MNKPSSTKERKETGILRVFKHFLRMWKIGKIYKVNKMGERADSCPIPTSTLKNWEEKLFQLYCVFLLTK